MQGPECFLTEKGDYDGVLFSGWVSCLDVHSVVPGLKTVIFIIRNGLQSFSLSSFLSIGGSSVV